MTGHLRVSSPWSQLGIFLGLFGGAFVISSVLMAAFILANGVPIQNADNIDWTKPELISTMKWIQGLSSILIFLLPAFLYARITFTSNPFYFLGLKQAEKSPMYGLAILCIMLAFPFVIWLGEINQHIPLPNWMTAMEKDTAKQMEALLKVKNTMDIVINVIIIAVLPAICEELCFRGALQRILIHCSKSPWAGIIITAILFSALHLQFQGFLPRMILGIVLGALYWYSGSLWTSILAHFVNNGVQVVAVSFAPKYISENPSMPVFAALISGVVLFIILWIYARLSTITYSKVYETSGLNMTNQFLA
ncbi:MAG: CPBP family intramembrane metalloprotease [Chitinophagaceae bacterium]|nr:CPBP family intramembrane metalloprotease [Chitinophagaceae bacterium]